MSATKTITLPPLHPGQEQVLAEQRKYNVVCCGRRWGKSVLATDIIVNDALDGWPVAYFTPTYKDLAEVWFSLKHTLRPVTATVNENLHQIRLMGGGIVDCWSLDNADSGRGRGYHTVLIDEAAMVKNLSQAWNATLSPTLADFARQGNVAWFFSTPKGLNDFHTLWTLHDSHPDWMSWQMPSSTNPHMAPEFIAAQEATLPAMIFQQEYLAQFIADGTGVFRRVAECATGEEKSPYPGTFVMGVDWGRVADFTVLVVMDAATGEVVEMDRFNQIDWHIQRGRLMALYHKWRVTAVIAEDNSIGNVNIEELQRDGLPIQPFVTGNATKRAIIERLTLAMENGTVRFPSAGAYQALVNELMAYQVEQLPGGLVRYGAPPGQHDDCVMALALAHHAARTRGGHAKRALESLPVYEVH